MTGWDRYQWTPERRAFLIESRGKLSTIQIAARLGTTVNVIGGAAKRMGLPRLPNPRLHRDNNNRRT